MTNPERALQVIIINTLKQILTPSTFYTHFPAGRSSGGGMRGRIRGRNLKSAGLVPGVPDLMFVHQGQTYFMELKVGYNKPSDDQISCHIALKTAGAHVEIVRSLDDALECLNLWRIPLRLSAAA